jgi:GGDEF domain-containing protein
MVYVLINQLKRTYGGDFTQSINFAYLITLFPLNLLLFYVVGRFRFLSSTSLKFITLLLIEYGVAEVLIKNQINLNVVIFGMNAISFLLFFSLILTILIKSINHNNMYEYTYLYVVISTATGIYYSQNSSGLSLFFFVAQLLIVIDLVYTLIYNHFYDGTTGFYSRNSYLLKSKHFPFKYNLGIVSIDNYDKLQKSFGYKKQKILTNLIAEVIQELTAEEEVFRYAPDQFVVLYRDKDNKESFAHIDNIRRIIAGLSFSWSSKQQPIKLTVSCSLAEKKRSDVGALDVLIRADKAMKKTLKFSHNVTSRG